MKKIKEEELIRQSLRPYLDPVIEVAIQKDKQMFQDATKFFFEAYNTISKNYAVMWLSMYLFTKGVYSYKLDMIYQPDQRTLTYFVKYNDSYHIIELEWDDKDGLYVDISDTELSYDEYELLKKEALRSGTIMSPVQRR